ncbi:MAG: hypothetical protein FWE95_01050 [Planctomycetaceae bacterium]|nr:hypothetical protein [Planctomycetaceae bacterium]
MKAITTFVSGLLLSAFFLLAPAVRAAELEPFFTVKVSNINTLVAVAERFAGMAEAADAPEFREFVNVVRNMRGFDLNSIAGVAVAVGPDGELISLLLLPITDLWRAEITGMPEIFDTLRPFLVRRDGGRFDINSPIGTFVALQKQGYLIIVPEDAVELVPADARTLFADLEKYTFGMKLDLEKVEFETIEAQLFGPMLLMAMMTNPDVAEQLENVVEIYRELYNEFAAVSSGITVNPQTGDVEISGAIVARKDSGMGKTFAGYKEQPTIFGGFRGTPDNTVFSMGDSATQPVLENNAMMDLNMKQYEAMFEGFLEQIEMEDETGELTELAEAAVAALLKIIESESKRGATDFALSLNTDGTFLFAIDTVSLAEIQKLAAIVAGFAENKIEGDAKTLIENNLRLGYANVEGFTVSSIKIPVIATLELIFGPAPDDTLSDLTLGVFWATKEGNKQAIATAAGLDFAKAEAAFRTALTQTRTAMPVRKPDGDFYLAGLGKFLEQSVYPIAVKAVESSGLSTAEELAPFKKVIDIFKASGNDATMTLAGEIKGEQMEATYRVSGKLIQAIISAVRVGVEESPFMRPGFRDF